MPVSPGERPTHATIGSMTSSPPDWDLRSAELAGAAIGDGRPTAWFDELYAEGAAGVIGVPWDRPAPLPPVVEHLRRRPPAVGSRAIVVGCGLGVDAEFLQEIGAGTQLEVTGFDISATAIELARTRHPDSAVDYQVGDLLDLPPHWLAAFELVLEVINVQALPLELRASAAAGVASLVAPGGRLVVVENVREDGAALSQRPPWGFTVADIELFAVGGLRIESSEQHPMATHGPAALRSRWLVEFSRPR